MINVCVIGFGHLGKWHCDKVESSRLAKLASIVDVNKSSHSLIQEKFPETKICESLEEALDTAEAFFIITPTSTHLDIFKTLFSHGKHIFCEKPFSDDLESSLELLKVSKNYSSQIMIGHSERCHGIWENVPAIDKNAFLELRREAPFKDRALDVSVLDDLMIHDIDLVHFLTKSSIVQVTAHCLKKRDDQYSEEYVEAYVETQSGVRARIVSDRDSVNPKRSLSIQASKPMFIDLAECKYQTREGTFSYEKRDHLQFEHNNFYRSILGEETVFTDFESGVEAMKVVHAIKESLRIGKKVSLT